VIADIAGVFPVDFQCAFMIGCQLLLRRKIKDNILLPQPKEGASKREQRVHREKPKEDVFAFLGLLGDLGGEKNLMLL